MKAERTAHRLQLEYAEYIEKECMTGDCEVDHSKADEVLVKYLTVIGCEDLVKAWNNVKKLYA